MEIHRHKFSLSKHPNADSLSVMTILGFTVIVNTQEFENEEYAVYIPIDAVAEKEDNKLLSFLDGKPVQVRKIRGIVSEGMALPFSVVKNYLTTELNFQEKTLEQIFSTNKNLAPILKITRWYSPDAPLTNGNNLTIPDFQKYTKIENGKKYPNIFLEDELVEVTEKLHGTSARYGILVNQESKETTFVSGSKNLIFNGSERNVWNKLAELEKVKEILTSLVAIHNKTVILYGEIVGKGIQDLNYGIEKPEFFVYDIYIDGYFVSPIEFQKLKEQYKFKSPPLFAHTEFKNIHQYISGQSLLDSNTVREGIVVKPLIPRKDFTIGRCILKYISNEYLMRNNPQDKRDI